MHAQQQQDNVEMRRSFNTSPNNICIQWGHSIEQAPHLTIVYIAWREVTTMQSLPERHRNAMEARIAKSFSLDTLPPLANRLVILL
jgi:hypothetical protein